MKISMNVKLKKRKYHDDLKLIEKALQCLADMIELQNLEITQIFNNERIIHDKINNYLYVFKKRLNNLQIRLIYAYDKYTNTLFLIDYYIKNRGGSKDNETYLKDMSKRYKNSTIDSFIFA